MALATPRNIVGYEETGLPDLQTFKIDNSTITYDATKANGAATTMIGMAVTLSADNTVALAADGEFVLGKLVSVEGDNKCSVKVHGHVTLPAGNGASVTRRKRIVGALDASSNKGYIREVATGTAAELGRARGFIINNGDTTAVGIQLD